MSASMLKTSGRDNADTCVVQQMYDFTHTNTHTGQ